jgi:hypothetical protein
MSRDGLLGDDVRQQPTRHPESFRSSKLSGDPDLTLPASDAPTGSTSGHPPHLPPLERADLHPQRILPLRRAAWATRCSGHAQGVPCPPALPLQGAAYPQDPNIRGYAARSAMRRQ